MRILIIDEVHDILLKKLKEKEYDINYSPNIKPENVRKEIPGFEGLILRSKMKIDAELIDKGEKLKFIARVGAGIENIDTIYAKEKGIHCINSPEGNKDAVGEHTLGLLLTLNNKILQSNGEVKKGIWERERNRGTELKNKTVGILGYGNMGSAFARKLKGLEVNVIAFDKYKFDYSNDYIKEVTFKEFVEQTDFLSIHIPLTKENKYLVDRTYLKKFHKPIILINTARGEVVKTDDLVSLLESGDIKGAALDVLEYEKSTFEELFDNTELPATMNKLIKSERVILTPHIAGWTDESYYKVSAIIAQKIINLFK
jgi:D-3-phosphoglycerate dehydrogenase